MNNVQRARLLAQVCRLQKEAASPWKPPMYIAGGSLLGGAGGAVLGGALGGRDGVTPGLLGGQVLGAVAGMALLIRDMKGQGRAQLTQLRQKKVRTEQDERNLAVLEDLAKGNEL